MFGVRSTAVRKWKGEKKKIVKSVVKTMMTTKERRRLSFLAFCFLTFMLQNQRLFVGDQEMVDFHCLRDAAAEINLPNCYCTGPWLHLGTYVKVFRGPQGSKRPIIVRSGKMQNSFRFFLIGGAASDKLKRSASFFESGKRNFKG